ncbi:MAG: hypothetical protein ABEJ87_01840 [Candidatus Nanohalobium sp.]
MFEGSGPDLLLHLLTTSVAAVLFAVSYRAYRKKENSKFIYICAAFGVFAVKEGVIAANTELVRPELTAAVHVLNLTILGLFFRGTIK